MVRKDIQIYRAVAVIAVIIYHFNVHFLPFGYLGVDLFFVISGYLITKQLLKNSKDKSIKLSVFYFKRFKRILPSLISSSLFTLVVGYYNLSLEHFYELFRGLKYSIFFVGNVFFAQTIDYFSIDANRNLIVNLWSLGVEEQFYIVFPLLVIVALKLKKIKIINFFVVCLLISLVSYTEFFYYKLDLNVIFFNFEKYIFYSPFTRSSQFLIGSIAATVNKKLFFNNSIISYLSIGALPLLFLFNLWSYNQFLISIIIFYLLLFETKISDNYINKLLFHIGNISYSLYLFHQPILAGIRNNNYYATQISEKYIDLENIYTLIGVFLIIYFVSIVNYLLIEQTYRKVTTINLLNFKAVFIGFLIIVVPAIQSSMVSSIYSEEFSLNEVLNIKVKPGTNYLLNEQNQMCIGKDSLDNACTFGTGEEDIYILGDSTIASLVNGIINDNSLNKYTITEYTKEGCYPVLNKCDFKEGTQYYEDVFSIKDSTIILGGIYREETLNKVNFSETLNKIIKNGNIVLLLGYIPSPGIDESMFFKKNAYYIKTNNINHFLEQELFNRNVKNFVSNLDVDKKDNLLYVDIFNTLCNSQYCNYFDDGEFLFIDGSHLSYLGAKNIVDNSDLSRLFNNT